LSVRGLVRIDNPSSVNPVSSVADPGCLSRIRPFLVIPDPTQIREVQNKPYFFLPDQMITVVNVHTKCNFSSFSIFLK
jgi:hypothetical protein